MIQERPYQREVFDAVNDFLENSLGNGIVAQPGGTGKSHEMNMIMRHAVTTWPGTRIMCLASDAKLLVQNSNAMLDYWPTAPIGIYSSGLNSRDTHQSIIYGGIQSVAKRAHEFGHVHLLIIDEADLVSPKEETLYQKFIAALLEVNPNMRVLGYTATAFRMGVGCLTNTDLWQKIIIDLTKTERFNWFIDDGILSPLVNKKGAVEVDITGIAMKGGDFDEKEMAAAFDSDEMHAAVVDEAIRYGADRSHWLVFSAGVKNGHTLAKMFKARGISAAMVTGSDSMEERHEIESKFRSGEIRVLVNCGLFLRGWDMTALDMIVWARATQSVALWVQGCVRGTRVVFPTKSGAKESNWYLWEDYYDGKYDLNTREGRLQCIADGPKQNCLVLDMAGNTRRLGQVNNPIIPQPRRKGDAIKGEAPLKICPECFSYIAIQCRTCPDCGFIFPPPKSIQKNATDADILARAPEPYEPRIEDFEVFGVRYSAVLSKANNYYLRVTYAFGTHRVHESLMFDSSSLYHKNRNKKWWLYHGGSLPIPEGVDEARDRALQELKEPSHVRVDMAKEKPEVVGTTFAEEENNDDPF